MPAIAPEAPINSILCMQGVGHEDEPADDTAEQVEGQKTQAAQRPLDVVAEHPQEHHVAEDMHDVGMEELIGDERRECRHPPRALHVAVKAAGVRLKYRSCGRARAGWPPLIEEKPD